MRYRRRDGDCGVVDVGIWHGFRGMDRLRTALTRTDGGLFLLQSLFLVEFPEGEWKMVL